jgi:hypothetical protein
MWGTLSYFDAEGSAWGFHCTLKLPPLTAEHSDVLQMATEAFYAAAGLPKEWPRGIAFLAVHCEITDLMSADAAHAVRVPVRGFLMNCLFFTTGFKVFTTYFHFSTTPPSILTTHPSILTTLLCSLRSEICCYLGLGRQAAHKIIISGDALTVSAPNICPSTTTVGTPYVRVICTGGASQSACRNVPSHGRYLSLWASRWAVRGGQTQN